MTSRICIRMGGTKQFLKAFLGTALPVLVCSAAFAQGAQGQHACAFVNDNFPGANTVEGYSVTGSNAVHVGPVATGGKGSPANLHTFFGTPLIAIAPGTTHLYASNNGTNDIALLDIDAVTCDLKFVAHYPSGGNSLAGLGIAISRDGKFLYASNNESAAKLAVLKINADGSLSKPVQTVSLSAGFSTLAITPDGKTLIATQATASQEVQAYTINTSTGKVTFASSVSTVGAADGVAIDSHSKFVYVGNGGQGGGDDVQVIKIGAGARLTYIADNVFGIRGSSNCLLLSNNGKLLYFSNQRGANVITLNVNPLSGAVSFNSIVSDGQSFVDEPSQLAQNSTGTLVFTGDFNTSGAPSMGIFQASANGTLKSIGVFPLAQNASATSIAAGSF